MGSQVNFGDRFFKARKQGVSYQPPPNKSGLVYSMQEIQNIPLIAPANAVSQLFTLQISSNDLVELVDLKMHILFRDSSTGVDYDISELGAAQPSTPNYIVNRAGSLVTFRFRNFSSFPLEVFLRPQNNTHDFNVLFYGGDVVRYTQVTPAIGDFCNIILAACYKL